MTENEPVDRRTFLAIAAAAATVAAYGNVEGSEMSQEPTMEKDAASGGITEETIREAEKLVGVQLDAKERAQIASSIGDDIEGFVRRRSVELPNALSPATVFDPVAASGRGLSIDSGTTIQRSPDNAGPLPTNDVDIAYAPVTSLSRWIERRELSATRLTEIYLDRLKRYAPSLECVVTVTEERAREQAKRADALLEEGKYLGRLHGIPYGAKDLFDTRGIATTWGAMPYKDRVATEDASVVEQLSEAGAVLVAKTTLGALAYGDIWFGGKTKSPWNTKRGSSGSSAGSASATAAGLVGFSLGTETYGSIVSPCMRCGTTGLRPTFGRVSRAGAMALCWSLDKVGPICRTVEDSALVLSAISAHDPRDASSVPATFGYDAARDVSGMRVGYSPRWFEGRRASDSDRRALEELRNLGVELVEIELPKAPYSSLLTILTVEAAAAFEELTLSNRDDELVWQEPQAWPNTFRKARFLPAIEVMQAQRFRRQVCTMMAERFDSVQAIASPSYAAQLLLITNFTGHPSLTLRSGFNEDGEPRGFTLWGRLFDERTLVELGSALEARLGVAGKRPPQFS